MSGNLNFLLGFVAGLCIIGGLASVRNPAARPPTIEKDQWVVQGSCPPPGGSTGQPLEVEDEFERAGRFHSLCVP
jgi:hypothetical protein